MSEYRSKQSVVHCYCFVWAKHKAEIVLSFYLFIYFLLNQKRFNEKMNSHNSIIEQTTLQLFCSEYTAANTARSCDEYFILHYFSRTTAYYLKCFSFSNMIYYFTITLSTEIRIVFLFITLNIFYKEFYFWVSKQTASLNV